MRTYSVNATMSVAAWVYVEADSPEDALQQAHSVPARDFEYDLGTAEVEFNVTPRVDPA